MSLLRTAKISKHIVNRIIKNVTKYTYCKLGYSEFEKASMFDKDTQLTGENRINPLHVFFTAICHNTMITAVIVPIDLPNLRLSTNIIMPNIKAIKQLFRNVIVIACWGV